jgi:hypothetical protein
MNKLEYTRQYNKDNYQAVTIRLDRNKDAHIIRALQESGSPKQYICRLIAADLRKVGTPIVSGNMASHDDVAGYPFEVLENLNGRHYIVGYCRTIDQARDMLVEYVQRQKKNCGKILILHRDVVPIGGGLNVCGGTI